MNPRLVSSSNQIQISVTTISRHKEDVINHLADAEIPRKGRINEVRSTRYSALKEKTPRISQYIRDPRSVSIVLDFARKPMKKTVIEIRRKQRLYAGSSPSVFQQTTATSSQLKIMSIVATIC
jgi:hypothetical protein